MNKPSQATNHKAFFLFIFLFITAQNLISQNISYDGTKLFLTNNSNTSLSFKIYNYKGEQIIPEVILSARKSKYFEHNERKDLSKGLKIEYYYSKGALQNDINILNNNIHSRKQEKFWENIFKGLFSAADEYFTGGTFSNLRTGLNLIFSTNDPERRQEALKEIELSIIKEGLKQKMTREEKAALEGIISAIQSNMEEDEIILFYEAQKGKLTHIQPFSVKKYSKSGKLVNKYLKNKITISYSQFNGLKSPGENIEFLNESNSFCFENETTFDFRINKDYSLHGKNRDNLHLTFGPYLSLRKFPKFTFNNEEISLFSPSIGGSGKIVIGNNSGVAGGIDLGISYNSLSKNQLVNVELEKIALNMTFEITIFTPFLSLNFGAQATTFEKTENDDPIVFGSSYIGIEIPLKKKYVYE